MGEDLAEILKLIEKQFEKQTRQLASIARDSEARLENMIEKRHNELKGSIDNIKKPKTKKPKNQKPKPKPNPKNQEPKNQKTRKPETKKPKNQNQNQKSKKPKIQKMLKKVCKIEGTDIVFCKRIGIRNLPVKPGIQSTKLMSRVQNQKIQIQNTKSGVQIQKIQKTLKKVCKIAGTDIVFCKRIGIRNLPVKPGINCVL
jgi:outer membrane biosynthesis protein TonB